MFWDVGFMELGVEVELHGGVSHRWRRIPGFMGLQVGMNVGILGDFVR